MKKVFSVHSGLGGVHLLYSGIHNFEKNNFFIFNLLKLNVNQEKVIRPRLISKIYLN